MVSLFKREPETIDGYVPKFSKAEVLMGYDVRMSEYKVGFGMAWDENDPHIGEKTYYHSIVILGHKIDGESSPEYGGPYYGMSNYDIVATICNRILKQTLDTYLPDVKKWLAENVDDLNNSRRYWQAYDHRQEIEKEKKKVAQLLRRIERAEWLASTKAVEVKEGRWLSKSERDLLMAEFSGGEYNEADARDD